MKVLYTYIHDHDDHDDLWRWMIHLMMIMEVMKVHDDDGVDTVPNDDDGDNAAPTPEDR